MAQNIDFSALRTRTMRSGEDEEAVTVDTRGLISKVLARYSGKWTVLREMMQNAADAGATRVTIKFETLPSTTVPLPTGGDQAGLIKHTISHHTLKRLLISNNGATFSDKDWARLKRIADGNPDESKIGAFGVGFYSVFDDCEEPFVSSGTQAMAFYWKGNGLFTRRLQLKEDASTETTFVLDNRNSSSPVPPLMELCQFLSSSLTFVSLERIELWLDKWNVLRLVKKTAPSTDVPIPRDIETRTAQGLMKILNVRRTVAQVDASWMQVVEWNPGASMFRLGGFRDTTGSLKTFFSRLTGQTNAEKPGYLESRKDPNEAEDVTKVLTASAFLHINTASIRPSVSTTLGKELERATRKPMPKETSLAVLMPSYDPGLEGESRPQSEVLSSILPTKAGRVFIGFPTHQTTGLNAHISAPSVIPTVERESIDLNTRYISKWNLEMLRAAGMTCRIAWTAEMAGIKSRILQQGDASKSQKIRKADIVGVLPEAAYVATQFVFRESTPSSLLGQTIEDAFWTCNSTASIEVLSTCGVIPSHQVRIAPKDLSFMESIPVLPDEFVSGAKDFVARLTDFGLVTDVTVSDIKRELEISALRPDQAIEFLVWLGHRATSGQLDASSVRSLLGAAVANDESAEGSPTRLLMFAEISCFLNPQRIPPELPLPSSVISYKFTKGLEHRELESLGWTELQIVPWIRWLVTSASDRSVLPVEQDITLTPSFSARVMPILSKQWESLSQSSKQSVLEVLTPRSIIPTKLGMKRPAETYFPSVRLFDDLPAVQGLNGVKEKFLLALGVRKTVDLEIIFDRLLSTTSYVGADSSEHRVWSHVDLIRYLASVRDDIPAEDIKRLKVTSICCAEAPEDIKVSERPQYKVSQLYEPKDSLRSLGLPVIEWPGKYQPGSREGKFFSMLGLKSHPSALELVQCMAAAAAKGNQRLFERLMSYFLSEYHVNGYSGFNSSTIGIPFLPLDGERGLSDPGRCFTDDGASLFGFQILRRDLHDSSSKLGVEKHPPLVDCLDVLIRQPPRTRRDAREIFKYLASRVTELSSQDIARLGNSEIVPITEATKGECRTIRRTAPKNCYLGDMEDYRGVFDFVDFGQEANLFLMAVGSKREPTKMEIVRTLVKEPARIYSAFQSPGKYLKLLASLSESLPTLRKDKALFNDMKRAAFLLGSRDIPSKTQGVAIETMSDVDDDDNDKGESIKEWVLATAEDVVVVDDFQSFVLFKEYILAAPQEEILEGFYLALGASSLSNLVEERAEWGSVDADQQSAERLQKLISERSRLFLHDQSSDSIRHDSRWLEKNLRTQVVSSISLTRSLGGRRISHVQKRSAIIARQSRLWTLWICPGKYNFYEISQALVHLILVRPKLHSTLTLEMLLKTDLLELKTRGYNVERILKQKAQEAKMAEDHRQKMLEEERALLNEREAAWKNAQSQSQQDKRSQKQDTMPGDFPDLPSKKNISPPEHTMVQSENRRPLSLLASLTKRLGFEGGRASVLSDNLLQASELSGSGIRPPPYSTGDSRETRPDKPVDFNPPHKMQSELLSAVQACRPHGSSSIYSRPQTDQISETKSYCDEKPSHDLEFVATLPSGINMFCPKTMKDRSTFLAQNQDGINQFASTLIECASIFTLRVDSVSVFYEPGGKTIAFNRAGSIFCNYFYFQHLHENQGVRNSNQSSADAFIYWWVILCHELAHNLVGDHSSAHSYYSEGFVTQYLPRVAKKVAADLGERSDI